MNTSSVAKVLPYTECVAYPRCEEKEFKNNGVRERLMLCHSGHEMNAGIPLHSTRSYHCPQERYILDQHTYMTSVTGTCPYLMNTRSLYTMV